MKLFKKFRAWVRRKRHKDKPVHSLPDKLLVQQVLYFQMAGSPRFSDRNFGNVKNMVEDFLEIQESRPGKNIWHRLTDPGEGFIGYVNLSPGEFRLDAPSGSNDVIVDILKKDESKDATLTSYLENCVSKIEAAPDVPSEYEELLNAARNVVAAARRNSPNPVLAAFWRDVNKIPLDPDNVCEETWRRFFSEYFWSFRLEGELFAPAMALVLLEASAGFWISGENFVHPISALHTYVRWCSLEVPEILRAAATIGNSLYRDGNSNLKIALKSLTLKDFYGNLASAALGFQMSTYIGHLSKDRISPEDFIYQPYLAEEGYAACITGLGNNLTDVTEGTHSSLTDDLKEIILEYGQAKAREHVRNLTRPTNPIYPVHYAKVSLASAMIEVDESRSAGLEMLVKLLDEFYNRGSVSEQASAEFDRLLLALIRGYSLSGNDHEAKRYAANFAGRMMVKKMLRM